MTDFSIDELLVPFDGTLVKMAVRIWQPDSVRATVFCIHGYWGNGADFSVLAKALAANGFKVVAPDLPGRGQSGYFKHRDQYSHAAMVQFLGHLVRYREKNVIIVASGWGALLSLSFLAVAKVQVERIVFCDAFFSSDAMSHLDRLSHLQRLGRHYDSLSDIEAILGQLTPQFLELPKEIRTSFIAQRFIQSHDGFRLHVDPNLFVDGETVLPEFDMRPFILSLRVPTLIIADHHINANELEFLDLASTKLPHLTISCGLKRSTPHFIATRDHIFLVLGFLLTRD